MGKPLAPWEIALIMVVTAFLVVMAIIAIWMDIPEGRDWHDGPPLDPDRAHLEQLATDQVRLFYWDTEFNVTFVRSESGFPVNVTNITCVDGAGNILQGANVTYLDLDVDGLVSLGDRILCKNMTDDFHGARFLMELNGTDFAGILIEWDRDDRLIYTLGFSWVYPARRNDSRWDTTFQLIHIRTDIEVQCAELTYLVQDEDGTVELTQATVVFNDTDGDGCASRWDRLELFGMTDDFESARVFVSYEGHVIGIADLPNFIPRP
jgi:hypothetical protein